MRVIPIVFDRVSHIAQAVSGFLDFDYISMGSHNLDKNDIFLGFCANLVQSCYLRPMLMGLAFMIAIST